MYPDCSFYMHMQHCSSTSHRILLGFALRPRLHSANPSAKCAALPDSGFFIDYQVQFESNRDPKKGTVEA